MSITRRQFLVSLTGVASILALDACTSATPAASPASQAAPAAAATSDQQITLKFAHTLAPNHLRTEIGNKFGDLAQTATNGRVKIEIYPAGQLYPTEQATLEAVLMNVIQLSTPTMGELAGYDKRFEIYNLPVLGNSLSDMDKLVDTPASLKLLDDLTAKGIKVFFYLPIGTSFTTSNKSISKVDDFKGLKIRAATAGFQAETIKAMGASPVAISIPEVYTALQQGTADGSWTTPDAAESSKLYEVQKSGLYAPLWHPVITFNTSVQFWNSLPADIRTKIESDVIPQLKDFARQRAKAKELESVGNLKKDGMALTELTVNSPDLAGFRSALLPVHDKFRAEIDGQLVDQVLETA